MAAVKNKGCLLMCPLMLKAKLNTNFQSPDLSEPNIGSFVTWESGVQIVAIFIAKRTSSHESTLFKPFCVKIDWGVKAQIGC